MEAVTFQQICIETEKFAPVLKFTRVENPNSEICLNMGLLCQDGFLYHDRISLFQPFQHLRCVTLCILSNQEDSPSKWSKCRTRHMYFNFFGFCEYTVVSRINPFCHHLSYKLPKTLLILPYDASKSRFKILGPSGRKNQKYGRV